MAQTLSTSPESAVAPVLDRARSIGNSCRRTSRVARPTALLAAIMTLVIPTHPTQAKPVAADNAGDVAQAWLNESSNRMGKRLNNRIRTVTPHLDADGEPLFYVVELAPNGYIVMAADDLIEPVIAFSDSGSVTELVDGNPLWTLLNSDLPERKRTARQINGAPAGNDPGKGGKHTDASGTDPTTAVRRAAERKQDKWRQYTEKAKQADALLYGTDPLPVSGRMSREERTPPPATGADLPGADSLYGTGLGSVSDIRISPFVASQWGQTTAQGAYCFNYHTPSHYPAGCVATALAQLMRYLQYPTAGIGLITNTIRVSGTPQDAVTRGGDGDGGAYDWSLMPLLPFAPATYVVDAQWSMIGALCSDVGIAVGMQYTSSESLASMSTARAALTNCFDFANAGYTYLSQGIDSTTFRRIINSNLAASLPVILGVRSTVSGHAVVCSGFGYSSGTEYHHIRMGWTSGDSDAWYNLPTISPAGWPPPLYYTAIDALIYNVFTNKTGEIISGRVVDQTGRAVASAVITATTSGDGPAFSSTSRSDGYYGVIVPSARSYTVQASKGIVESVTTNVTVETTGYGVCANLWGVDLVLTNSFTFTAQARTDSIILDWTDPSEIVGSGTAMIRWAVTNYPASTNSGTQVYLGTLNTFTHTNITQYQTQYYSIWLSDDGTNFMAPPFGASQASASCRPTPATLVMRSDTPLPSGSTETRLLFFANDDTSQLRDNAEQPTAFSLPTQWIIEGVGCFNKSQTNAALNSDQILYRHSGGNLALSYFDSSGSIVWNTNNCTGNNLVPMNDALSDTNLASTDKANWTLEAIGDVNADGQDEIVTRCSTALPNGSTQIKVLFFTDNGTGRIRAANQPPPFVAPAAWMIQTMGCFNKNQTNSVTGGDQILWRHSGGGLALSYFNSSGQIVYNTNNCTGNNSLPGSTFLSDTNLGLTSQIAADWVVQAKGDVNGDGQDEIFMRCTQTLPNGTSQVRLLLLEDDGSGQFKATQNSPFAVGPRWTIQTMGNFNTSTNTYNAAPAAEELLWRDSVNGNLALSYFKTDGTVLYSTNVPCSVNNLISGTNFASDAAAWHVQAVGNLGDGESN